MTVGKYVRYLFLAFLALWLLFTLFPLYFMLITALKSAAETNLTVPTFWPKQWFPQNFVGVFAEPTNFSALIDSFIIATGNTVLALFLGSLAGYAFARYPKQAGGENLAFWILSNRMFPPVAILVPMFFLVRCHTMGYGQPYKPDHSVPDIQSTARYLADDGVFPRCTTRTGGGGLS